MTKKKTAAEDEFNPPPGGLFGGGDIDPGSSPGTDSSSSGAGPPSSSPGTDSSDTPPSSSSPPPSSSSAPSSSSSSCVGRFAECCCDVCGIGRCLGSPLYLTVFNPLLLPHCHHYWFRQAFPLYWVPAAEVWTGSYTHPSGQAGIAGTFFIDPDSPSLNCCGYFSGSAGFTCGIPVSYSITPGCKYLSEDLLPLGGGYIAEFRNPTQALEVCITERANETIPPLYPHCAERMPSQLTATITRICPFGPCPAACNLNGIYTLQYSNGTYWYDGSKCGSTKFWLAYRPYAKVFYIGCCCPNTTAQGWGAGNATITDCDPFRAVNTDFFGVAIPGGAQCFLGVQYYSFLLEEIP